MRYAYFPGCTLSSSGYAYDLSFKYVARALGLELIEVRDWTCCGASIAQVTSRRLSLALPILNLSRAERDGFPELIAPCPACLSRFKTANHEWEHNPDLRSNIQGALDSPYQGKVKVYHPLEIFAELGLGKIRERVKRKISGLKIASYYGCLLTRPPKIAQFDDAENPKSMDSILWALGAEPVDWFFKTECCGAAMTLTQSDMVLRLSNEILREAKEAGANLIAVACPLCQTNLDARQKQVEQAYHVRYGLPILYFTQLMGFAFGAFQKELGTRNLITNPEHVLGPIGLM